MFEPRLTRGMIAPPGKFFAVVPIQIEISNICDLSDILCRHFDEIRSTTLPGARVYRQKPFGPGGGCHVRKFKIVILRLLRIMVLKLTVFVRNYFVKSKTGRNSDICKHACFKRRNKTEKNPH